MVYKKINEIPCWALKTVEKMISTGLIQNSDGEFEYPLTDNMLYIFLIMARVGML